jgi:ATP-binding cassette subfamily B protein
MGRVPIGRMERNAEARYSDRELGRRIAERLLPERRSVIGLGALTLLRSLLNVLSPLLISHSIDRAVVQPTAAAVLVLSTAIAVAGVADWLADYFYRRLRWRMVANAVLDLRQDLFAAAMHQDMRFHDRAATGDLVTQVTSDTRSFGQVVELVSNALSSALMTVTLTIVLFIIDWQLALLAMLIVPFIVLVALGLRHLSRPAAVRERKMRAVIGQSIAQAIAGIGVAKVFRQEQALYDTFSQVNEQSYRVDLRRGLVVESVFPAFFALRALVTTAMVYAGGLAVQGGRISAGTWYLFIRALGSYVDPMIELASFWRRFQDGLASCEHIFALLDAPQDVVQLDARPVPHLRGEIEFRRVHFCYRPGEDVLTDFSSVGSRRADAGLCRAYGRGQVEPGPPDRPLLRVPGRRLADRRAGHPFL